MEAPVRLGVRCSPRTARPTHGVGSARGGRSLVAGRAASGCRAHGRVHAQALALLERHGVLTRRRSLPKASTADSPGSTPSCEPSRRRAGSGADTSSTAWERRSSPGRRARSAPRGPRRGRGLGGNGCVRSRGGRPGRSVRCRPRLATPRRRGPPTPAARGRGVRRPGRRDRGPLPGTRWLVAPDPPRGRRPEHRPDGPARATTIVAGGRLRELVIRKVDGVTIGESPWRDRLLEVGFTAGYRGLTLRAAR